MLAAEPAQRVSQSVALLHSGDNRLSECTKGCQEHLWRASVTGIVKDVTKPALLLFMPKLRVVGHVHWAPQTGQMDTQGHQATTSLTSA